MKSSSFLIDGKIYELLKKQKTFTTNDLRDAYAATITGTIFKLADLRLYVYEQIRRMIRVGWIVPDKQHKKRGQVFHLQSQPNKLEIQFIEDGFIKWHKGDKQSVVQDKPSTDIPAEPIAFLGTPSVLNECQHIEEQMKEVQLDFLTSIGEIERYKQLMRDFPEIKSKIEKEYIEARDQSSRLLGHLRAMEKTLYILSNS